MEATLQPLEYLDKLDSLGLDLGVEELDEMLDPIDWGEFFTGVGIGVGLVGLYAAGVGIAT